MTTLQGPARIDAQGRMITSGKKLFPDGSLYEGGFADGKRDGDNCLMKYADGSRYQGSFRNNQTAGNCHSLSVHAFLSAAAHMPVSHLCRLPACSFLQVLVK